jgi:hypothetical protein
MIEPGVTVDGVVTPLIEEQLQVAAQRRIHFAVAVEVWGHRPRAAFVMQVKNAALADVQKDANGTAAAGQVTRQPTSGRNER